FRSFLLVAFDGGLILLGNTLYGTTERAVFALHTDGTGFTNLHTFTGGSDGAIPFAGLITNLSGNTLYGTTRYGGPSGYGNVFAVNTDGTGFTTLYSFTATSPSINTDAAVPSGLVLSGSTLYGTAWSGGGCGL